MWLNLISTHHIWGFRHVHPTSNSSIVACLRRPQQCVVSCVITTYVTYVFVYIYIYICMYTYIYIHCPYTLNVGLYVQNLYIRQYIYIYVSIKQHKYLDVKPCSHRSYPYNICRRIQWGGRNVTGHWLTIPWCNCFFVDMGYWGFHSHGDTPKWFVDTGKSH